MIDFLVGRFTPGKQAELHCLIDELGLIPSYLITPSLLSAYRAELFSVCDKKTAESIKRDQAIEFLEEFDRRYHSRPKSDDIFVQLNFDFES